MTAPSTRSDARPQESAASTSRDGAVPSGFILKLFQMVNGAPDDLISWLPSGDAFKIGADLNRLESDTLPQYFRHSRFQSLVRQLNFYNFRKVNRERNFWVYKHHLFHRDRPEDLHLLRRRTCPGVDGRKHRIIPSSSNRSVSSMDSVNNDGSPAEKESRDASSTRTGSYSSDDSDSAPSESTKSRKNKRLMAHDDTPETKRPRRGVDSYGEEKKCEDEANVARHPRRLNGSQDSDEEASGFTSEKVGRTEMMLQSLVVSEVSRKLEEYVRMAKKGLTRTRSGRAGVVTPPGAGSRRAPVELQDAGGLLTYDDEFSDDESDSYPKMLGNRSNSSAVVSDGDDSTSGDEEATEMECPPKSQVLNELFLSPPIKDVDTVKAVTTKLLSPSSMDQEEQLFSVASVVGFCMITAPGDAGELCSKILQLLSSSSELSTEFQTYRSALHPLECSVDSLPSFTFVPSYRKNPAISAQRIWESAASRNEAVRDFKTFAVNYIQGAVKMHPANSHFSENDLVALKHTADVWLKSACLS